MLCASLRDKKAEHIREIVQSEKTIPHVVGQAANF